MATANFLLEVSHAQICVFQSTLELPFNDWSETHVAQGFAWRPGSACFRTVLDAGQHLVNLAVNEPVPSISEACVRAFKVPFDALDGNLELASVSDSIPISIPPGRFTLQVEFLDPIGGEAVVNVRLNLGPTDFKVLKADGSLHIPAELDLLAAPAF